MSTIPSVSIVIPTLNEEKYLPLLLESLRKLDAPLQIIVVDGGSKDTTVLVAEEYKKYFTGDKTLQCIALDTKGIAMQRNVGAMHATHEHIFFCDADSIAPSTSEYTCIISEFVKERHVVATAKIVSIERKISFIFFHAFFYGIQKMLAFLGKPYFSGQYLLTTKSAFLSVGGFDESLRISEDVDFSLRVSKYGTFKIFPIPIQVSTRRFQKYGYSWLFTNPSTLLKLLFKGKITNEDKIFYPFGEY